ncbi:MAG: arginine--tRNA ligase [Prevotellaceae bacterium]|jgi:arginyl-tRNA synthetase|nr:arginine--tRNA ligase [Prevotellaceae bacterium]
MSIEKLMQSYTLLAVEQLYGFTVNDKQIQIQITNKDFEGDYTLVVFPLLRISRKTPEATANEIGEKLKSSYAVIQSYNVIKGFLNIKFTSEFWIKRLNDAVENENFGFSCGNGKKLMIEYSSPNTNKPLHLGHVRNNLLGYAVANILEASGNDVVKVNLVNDRGVHICKSMLAWQKFGNGETPESSGKKGDHLVGEYYVRYDSEYKKQLAEIVASGIAEDEAKRNVPIQLEVQEMLRKWEAKDTETIALWEKMNSWVYAGFDKTYNDMGVSFDKIYYESQTYLLGKTLVKEGLDKGVFFKKEDGSVWIDLTADGLDQKLLLRSDETSVYITQDLGTAQQRVAEYNIEQMIYVVGNEQNYHFQVLKLILKKLGFAWADSIYHLSYGMVELPEGKMKSREGTVVDADDLIELMISTAHEMSKELGKLDDLSDVEINNVCRMVGLGALKYFILKVDPKKTMLFDPKESIDFNGNTGPFIQYTYARINSILRKADEQQIKIPKTSVCANISEKEISIIKLIDTFPATLALAAKEFSPAVIANYAYDIAKEFNQFYHEHQILREENEDLKLFRLMLSKKVAIMIKKSMKLLGIDVPDRM